MVFTVEDKAIKGVGSNSNEVDNISVIDINDISFLKSLYLLSPKIWYS